MLKHTIRKGAEEVPFEVVLGSAVGDVPGFGMMVSLNQILGRLSISLAACVVCLVGAIAGCSKPSRPSAGDQGSVQLQPGPVQSEWTVAATGVFRDTSWTLESRQETAGICVRLRSTTGPLMTPPSCPSEVATVVGMALLDPGENDGYLIGVTDDRVRSLRFTTTKGTVRVPVTRQAFVLWTTDAFRELKWYDALGDGDRVLAAHSQCDQSGCA